MAPAPRTTIASGCGTKVQEEFLVAGGARNRGGHHAKPFEAARRGCGRYPCDARLMDGRIRDDAVLAHLVATGFELRLHEGNDISTRLEKRRQRGEDVPQGDECHVDGNETHAVGDVIRRQRTGIDPLAHQNARVVAKAPVQLASTDVERDHAGRAAPQQHVGEAARRCADVESSSPRRIDRKGVEGSRELHAAAADVRVVGRRQFHAGVVPDRRAGLRDHLSVDGYLTGQNERAGPLPRRRQAEVHERNIETRAGSRHGRLNTQDTKDARARPFGSDPLYPLCPSCWCTWRQLRRVTTQSAIPPSRLSAIPAPASAACARPRHSVASACERSSPKSAGYVGLADAASFPDVLPSDAALPSTSRISSTIWNARPTSRA